jgi:hypothetical protein
MARAVRGRGIGGGVVETSGDGSRRGEGRGEVAGLGMGNRDGSVGRDGRGGVGEGRVGGVVWAESPKEGRHDARSGASQKRHLEELCAFAVLQAALPPTRSAPFEKTKTKQIAWGREGEREAESG